jgi:hypothetical protein
MARAAYPIEHFVKMIDKGNNKFQARWYSNGTVYATAQDLNLSMVTALEALTDCFIVEAGYTFRFVEPDQTPLATYGEGEKKAMVSCALVTSSPPNPGQTKFAQILIPAPKESLFLATAGDGANIVDVENADLVAFLENFAVGAGLLPHLTLSDFQAIKDPNVPANLSGKRVTRKSNNG